MFLSIITPTYNRAYILKQCYESLCSQTCKDFEWIIIDDGSIDNTEKLVQSFIAEGQITIKYKKQVNGGKHRAHNAGVMLAEGVLTVCVDSDDALTENAIAKAKDVWNSNYDKRIAGILALRGSFIDQKPICSNVPINVKYVTLFELIHEYGFKGDTVLFYDTRIMKSNLFKEFCDEKFLSEVSLYFEIDNILPLLALDEVLYLCDYLEDGLSARYLQLLKQNPKGTAYCYYVFYKNSRRIYHKLKYATIAKAYMQTVHDKNQLHFIDFGFLSFITLLPSIIYRIFRINKVMVKQ